MGAEFFQFFVQGETGWLGCDFEQHAARLAEINGMKVRAIDYRRDVVAEVDEMLAPLELFGFVFRAKGNVMHRTSRDAAGRGVGLTQEVDNSARRGVVRGCKPKPIPRFFNQSLAEALGQ